MKGPLLLKPHEVLDLSKTRPKKVVGSAGTEKPDRSLTEKVSGGRGRIAMKKIIQGVVKLQETQNSDEAKENSEEFAFGVSLEGIRGDENSRVGGKIPWLKTEKVVFRRMKKEKVVTTAELTLDPILLERLRGEAVKMRKWVKVKKAGVTQGVVDQIYMVWKSSELAMVKIDLPLCRNMDRAREIVEVKFLSSPALDFCDVIMCLENQIGCYIFVLPFKLNLFYTVVQEQLLSKLKHFCLVLEPWTPPLPMLLHFTPVKSFSKLNMVAFELGPLFWLVFC